MAADAPGLFAFVVVTGLIHGAEPGHGWPVAAAYALSTDRPWVRGLTAAVVLGVGHLTSSVVVVLGYFGLTAATGLSTVPYLDYVAGVLLVALGVREYRRGGHHGPGDDRAPDGARAAVDATHSPGRREATDDHGGGLRERVLSALGTDAAERPTGSDAVGGGMRGIAWTAFVLGFAHEEEFELIGVCTGTPLCVELTLAYAASVLSALVAMTAVLLAGYERHEQRVEEYAEHFPTVSAAVLVLTGLGFLAGVF
ncbi:hypothetical protein BRD18_01090 [Halobacteriales archaeon SW_7_71_33]|nr:MAG: hypothetical protein BRD18_01090 [Halobacteriales archaeon SW_7_71_33]